MRGTVAVALVVSLAACGKSSSPAPAPPPAPEPDGNPTTTQPSPSQPSPPSQPPAPEPDRFATVERLDQDPACGDALSDGRGFVAAAVISHLSNGNNELTWQAFRPDGSAGQQMTRSADDPIIALPDGWQGAAGRQGVPANPPVVTWFGDGAVHNDVHRSDERVQHAPLVPSSQIRTADRSSSRPARRTRWEAASAGTPGASGRSGMRAPRRPSGATSALRVERRGGAPARAARPGRGRPLAHAGRPGGGT